MFGSSRDLFSSVTSRSRPQCSRRMVCIESCTKGDNVIVMWNSAHGQYTIYQVRKTQPVLRIFLICFLFFLG